MTVERGRRRLRFDPADSYAAAEVHRWDGRPLRLTFPGRDPVKVQVGDLSQPAIAAPLIDVILELASMPGGPIGSFGSAVNAVASVRRFDEFLTSKRLLGPGTGLDGLRGEHLDRFEADQRGRYALHSTMPYQHVNNLVVLLRQVDQHALDPSLRGRLRWVANGPVGRKFPKDAYDDATRDRLRRACRRDIAAVVRRLTVTGPKVLADGEDPAVGGWTTMANLVWLAHHDGVVNKRRLFANGARYKHFKGHDALNMTAIRGLVFPSHRDLVPFAVLLVLETGLEIECVRELDRDCLLTPTDDGFVTIRYVKRRAKGQEQKTLRVRDGGRFTPGGVIRTVLRLTRRAAELTGDSRLWQHCGPQGLARTPLAPRAGHSHRRPIESFVNDHGLVGVDGAPLGIDFQRLRKTHKQHRYLAVGGDIPLFAVGHTERVAARHYADIPALRSAHDAAVAAGLTQARDLDALQTEQTETPTEATVDVVPSGPAEQELWLASCTDFFNSPFTAAGKPCGAAFFNCLGCANAVVGEDKLPTILRFLDFLLTQRTQLAAEDWAARFGDSYQRITHRILPAFPADVVDHARVIAEADQDLTALDALWTSLTESLS